MKRILIALLIAGLLCVPAYAADLPASGTQTVDAPNNQTIIPVNISAEATQLDVTVPTAFPIAMDPSGTVATATTPPTIINNSYGAIVVKNITVKDNAVAGDAPVAADWHLAAYDKDMSLADVDSNLVGIAVAPKGGRSSADGTDFLKTTDSDQASQVLLDTVNAKWVLDGKTADRTTDELGIVYDSNVTAVSATITNKTVANIVITIGWFTGIPATT